MTGRTRLLAVVAGLALVAAIGVVLRPTDDEPEPDTSSPRIQDTLGVPLDPDPDPDPPSGFLPGPEPSE